MKKLLVISGLALGVAGTGLGSSVLFNGVANGEWDLPGLQQQVQHNTEELNNHEVRIQNAEGNIKQLQDNTNTPPAANQQPAPSVTTPEASQSTPTAQTTTTAPAPTTTDTAPAAPPQYVSTRYYTEPDTCNEYAVDTYSDGSTQTHLVSTDCNVKVSN